MLQKQERGKILLTVLDAASPFVEWEGPEKKTQLTKQLRASANRGLPQTAVSSGLARLNYVPMFSSCRFGHHFGLRRTACGISHPPYPPISIRFLNAGSQGGPGYRLISLTSPTWRAGSRRTSRSITVSRLRSIWEHESMGHRRGGGRLGGCRKVDPQFRSRVRSK